MPGYVADMTLAYRELALAAGDNQQRREVRGALHENLRETRLAHPEYTFGQALTQATKATGNEIRADYDAMNTELERSQEFGAVRFSNVALANGNLGSSEQRLFFEIRKTDAGYETHLHRTSYLYEGGQLVAERELSVAGGSLFGPFEIKQQAQKFVQTFIADYAAAASDHYKAGLELVHQYRHEEGESFGYSIGA